MKCVILCLVLSIAVATYGLPQRVELVGIPSRAIFGYAPFDSRSKEVEGDTSDDTIGTDPVESVSDYDPSYFYSGSISDMFNNMQAWMIRLRQEMDEILTRIPEHPTKSGEGSDEFPIFSSSDFDFSNAKNKSTSKTEIIDGQLYTVNETVITSGNDGAGSIFHVKTIQIKPTAGSETDTVTDEPQEVDAKVEPSPTLSSRNSNDENNVIPNDKVQLSEWNSEEISPPDHVNEIETIDNDVETLEPKKSAPIYDLSRDTLVNDYISDHHQSQGIVMINPDAEFIDVDSLNPKRDDYYRYESQPVSLKEEGRFEKLLDTPTE